LRKIAGDGIFYSQWGAATTTTCKEPAAEPFLAF